jgi:cyclophilin family peptidyl-prolyl cis-trans isomerase
MMRVIRSIIIFAIFLMGVKTILGFYDFGFSYPLNNYEKIGSDNLKHNFDWYVFQGLGESKYAPGHLGEDWTLKKASYVGNNDIQEQFVYPAANGRVYKIARWPECSSCREKTSSEQKNGCAKNCTLNDGASGCVESNHGWGSVVIIKHEIPSDLSESFNSNNSILRGNPSKNIKPSPVIENPKVVYTLYAHLKDIPTDLVEGQEVFKGKNELGKIGSICEAYPSVKRYSPLHLHFEIKDQNSIDRESKIGNIPGIGFGYSHIDGYAPNRYIPSQFIKDNGEVTIDVNKTMGQAEVKAFASSCDNGDAKGMVSYSLDIWSFAKSSGDEFVDGTFAGKNGCEVNVWLGIQGSFCGVGEAKEPNCSEKADTLAINGNKVDRLSAVKGKAFFADYYVHVDDKSCCNEAGCGHDFDFQLSSPDEETGKKCMADFEEMLRSLRLKGGEAAKAETLAEKKPVSVETAASNQPPSEAEINLIKNGGDISATIATNKGTIELQLYGGKTPVTVANFVKLARSGFYNGLKFHRVIQGFMIQGGDPLTKDESQKTKWGTGAPGYNFNDEPFSGEYVRGTLAMANSGPNTNGSQFFIMQKDYPLPHTYVIFGKVTKGLDVIDAIVGVKTDSRDCPIDPIIIGSVKIN